MKKFLSVLAIALIAMTAVFAATNESSITNKSSDLTLKLTVNSETTVGFTSTQMATDASALTDTITEKPVTANATTEGIFASYISTCNTPVTVSVAVSKALTHVNSSTQVIETTLEGETSKKESGTITGKRAFSLPVKVKVGSAVGMLAGSYEGTLTMTVTAND